MAILLGILYVLLWTLGLILLLVLLLLISPIFGELNIKDNQIRFRGHYFFKGIQFFYEDKETCLKIFGFKIKGKSEKTDKKKKDQAPSTNEDEKKEKPKKEKKSFLKSRGLPSKELIFLTLGEVKKLILAVVPKKAVLNVRVGLDDPYDSGLVSLIMQTLCLPLNAVKGYSFHIIPVYDDYEFEANGTFLVRFSLLQLLWIVIRFCLRKPVRDYMGWQIFRKKKMTTGA